MNRTVESSAFNVFEHHRHSSMHDIMTGQNFDTKVDKKWGQEISKRISMRALGKGNRGESMLE